jgi:HSP20 family protein
MAIQVWDPFNDLKQMEDNINRLWRSVGGVPVSYRAGIENWNIPIDVIQKPEEILVKALMPGVKPEDIDVSIEDNVLTIKAETRGESETKDEDYLIRECHSGSFFRGLRLPEAVDTNKIKTNYEHGILEIVLPKAEERKKKQIKISVGSTGKTIQPDNKS